jgi:UPF0755 protein
VSLLSKRIRLFVLPVVLVAGLVAVSIVVGEFYRFMKSPASDDSSSVIFEVATGDSLKQVAIKLEAAGLIRDAGKFRLLVRLLGGGAKARAGEYEVRKNLQPAQVLAIIASGKSIEYAITVPEGYNVFEIAQIVAAKKLASSEQFIQLVHDQKLAKELLGKGLLGDGALVKGPTINKLSSSKAAASGEIQTEAQIGLEGFLYPDTYKVTRLEGPKGLIRMMVNRFKQTFDGIPKSEDWNKAGLTPYELVTLASIIEKETGAPEERPIISSVFHNRLKLKMRLQTDPTVIYGVWEQSGIWNRNISRNDLTTPTRYNTYTLDGLPFGPVANPGIEALRAAGLPAKSDLLFFVSRNDGTHIFSKNYQQHLAAVSQFQLNAKAREGKSWRDLNKRTKASVVK